MAKIKINNGGGIKVNNGNSVNVGTNKHIVFFGDSVTEFGTYPEQCCERIRAVAYKAGVGGCRMGQHQLSDYNAFSMTSLADAVVSSDFSLQQTAIDNLKAIGDNNTAALKRLQEANFQKTINIAVIGFGTNDFTSNYISVGNSIDENKLTIKGAANYSINKLLSAYPDLNIALVTPTHRFFGPGETNDSDIVPNGLGSFLLDYVDALIEVGQYHNIPVLDLYRTSGFNASNHSSFFVDGVHPNAAGYTIIAEKVSDFLYQNFY